MKNLQTYITLVLAVFFMQAIIGQEKIDYWEYQKEILIKKEKALLAMELSKIDKRISENEISVEDVQKLKVEVENLLELLLLQYHPIVWIYLLITF